MKRTMMNSFMAVALVAGTALHAQSSQKVKATVPFDFHAGNVAMAAGDYSIAPISENALLTLNIAGHQRNTKSAVASGITSKQDNGHARLVFQSYQGEYYLTQVCNGADCTELVKDKKVREWQAKGVSPEIVTVNALGF